MYQTTCMYEFDGQAALCRGAVCNPDRRTARVSGPILGGVDSGKNYH